MTQKVKGTTYTHSYFVTLPSWCKESIFCLCISSTGRICCCFWSCYCSNITTQQRESSDRHIYVSPLLRMLVVALRFLLTATTTRNLLYAYVVGNARSCPSPLGLLRRSPASLQRLAAWNLICLRRPRLEYNDIHLLPPWYMIPRS